MSNTGSIPIQVTGTVWQDTFVTIGECWLSMANSPVTSQHVSISQPQKHFAKTKVLRHSRAPNPSLNET